MSNLLATRRSRHPPRVLFFGRPCRLSSIPLLYLLREGIEVCGVVVPARRAAPGQPPIRLRRALPLVTRLLDAESDLVGLATRHRVPVLEASTLRHPSVERAVRDLAPDVLVVSCFPWRLSDDLLADVPLGGINVHPSALPEYRGPDPLFWIYRDGRLRCGTTVHRLTAELDAGPVIVQASFDLPLGLPGDALERQVAHTGGRLLVDSVRALASGTAVARAQPHQRASYRSWPTASDLIVTPDWPAWRAVHFIRGVVPLGYHPRYVPSDRARQVVIRGLARWYRSAADSPATGVHDRHALLAVRDGILHVQVAPEEIYS